MSSNNSSDSENKIVESESNSIVVKKMASPVVTNIITPETNTIGTAVKMSDKHFSTHEDFKKEIDDLKNEMNEIQKLLDKLCNKNGKTKKGDYRGRFKERKPKLNGGKAKSKAKPKIDYNLPENKGRCQFHILHGDKAYHCKVPCIDSDKPLAQRLPKNQNEKLNSKARQY